MVFSTSETFRHIPYVKTVLQNTYNKTQAIVTKLFSYFQGAGLDFCPLYVIYFQPCILHSEP